MLKRFQLPMIIANDIMIKCIISFLNVLYHKFTQTQHIIFPLWHENKIFEISFEKTYNLNMITIPWL